MSSESQNGATTPTGAGAKSKESLRALLLSEQAAAGGAGAGDGAASFAPAPGSVAGGRSAKGSRASATAAARDVATPTATSAPLGPSSASAATKRKGTRKNARTIVSHAAPGRLMDPAFRFTRFATTTSNVDITRNVASRFLVHPAQNVLRHRMHPHGADVPEPTRVVVLHPGSRNLRAGLVTDTVPKVMPNVIARRMRPRQPQAATVTAAAAQSASVSGTAGGDTATDHSQPHHVKYREDQAEEHMLAQHARASLEDHFKTKMKQAALRTPINSVQLVQSFNGASRKVAVPALNDPLHVEWHSVPDEGEGGSAPPEYLVGQRALDLDDDARKAYRLLWPFYAKSANTRDYAVAAEWRHDVRAIWEHMLLEELGIGRAAAASPTAAPAPIHPAAPPSTVPNADPAPAAGVNGDSASFVLTPAEELRRTRVVLVVPDLMDARAVEDLMAVLLVDLGVHSVLVGQESLLSCVGAGLSTACVVDVGAQATSLAVIENGDLVDATRILVGGDDVTQVLYDLMCENRFPLARHMGPSLTPSDLVPPRFQALVEDIKEKWCTCNEQELAVQVVDVFLREPGQVTIKHQIKVYNEVYMAPLCFFYPAVIRTTEKLKNLRRNPNNWLAASYSGSVATSGLTTMLTPPVIVPAPAHPGLSPRTTLTAQLMYMQFLEEGSVDEEAIAAAASASVPTVIESGTATPAVATVALKHPCVVEEPKPEPVEEKEKESAPPDDKKKDKGSDGDEGTTPPTTTRRLRRETRASAAAAAAAAAAAQRGEPVDAMDVDKEPPTPAAPPGPPPPLTLSTFAREWVARPLDAALHALVQGVRSEDRMRKLYASILLLGGPAQTPGFASRALEDRIRNTMPALGAGVGVPLAPGAPGAGGSAGPASAAPAMPAGAEAAAGHPVTVSVTPPPREMDPRTLPWKGGTVLARLECANDMWVTAGEMLGYGGAAAVAYRAGIVLAGSAISGGMGSGMAEA